MRREHLTAQPQFGARAVGDYGSLGRLHLSYCHKAIPVDCLLQTAPRAKSLYESSQTRFAAQIRFALLVEMSVQADSFDVLKVVQ